MTKHAITPVQVLGKTFNTLVVEGNIPLNQDKFNASGVVFFFDENADAPNGGRRNPSFKMDVEVVKADLPSVTEQEVIKFVASQVGVTLK